jgi:hypothetical protein
MQSPTRDDEQEQMRLAYAKVVWSFIHQQIFVSTDADESSVVVERIVDLDAHTNENQVPMSDLKKLPY